MISQEKSYDVICAQYQAMLRSNNNFPYENQRCRNTTEMETTLKEFENVDKTLIPNKGEKQNDKQFIQSK